MTFYEVIFEDGGRALFDSKVLESQVRRGMFGFGILGFLKSLSRKWKEINKVTFLTRKGASGVGG